MYSFHSSVNYDRLTLLNNLSTPEVIIVRSDGMRYKITTYNTTHKIIQAIVHHTASYKCKILYARAPTIDPVIRYTPILVITRRALICINNAKKIMATINISMRTIERA